MCGSTELRNLRSSPTSMSNASMVFYRELVMGSVEMDEREFTDF
jgi:hypothetical protein